MSYRYYRQPDVIAAFEPLRKKLVHELPAADHIASNKELARFTEKLQLFQYAVLGPPAVAEGLPIQLVRIPNKLFKDLSPDGSLYTMLRTAYKWRLEHGLKKWDLENASRRSMYLELLSTLAKSLSDKGFIRQICIAFAKSLPDDVREELYELAAQMQASVVPYMTPEVTHVIQDAPEHELEEDNSEEWWRTLEKRDGYVLLHYWYKPDSADVWVSEKTGDYLDPEPAPEHKGPWYLAVRWLRDSVANNEWMNEEDYEAENPEPPDDQADFEIAEEDEMDTKSFSYTGSPGQALSTAADTLDIDDEDSMSIAGSDFREGPIPVPHIKVVDLDRKGIRARKYEYEPIPESVVHNISHTIKMELPGRTSYVGDQGANEVERWLFLAKPSISDKPIPMAIEPDKEAPNEAAPIKSEADVAPESELKPIMPPQPAYTETASSLATYQIVNANNAPWFTLSSVSDLERNIFPKFFDSSSSRDEKHYLYLRDSMIIAFRRNMGNYLTIEECYRHLNGKLEDVVAIHRFLAHWGLINLQVQESEPTGLTSLYAQLLTAAVTGDAKPTPKNSVALVYDSPMIPPQKPAFPVVPSSIKGVQIDETTTSQPSADEPSAPIPSSPFPTPISCTTCKRPCGTYRYLLTKPPHIELCADCFLEGRFPADLSSKNFAALQGLSANIAQSKQEDSEMEQWTEEEVLRLLEAIEGQHPANGGQNGSWDCDWNHVSEYVGTRSPHECAKKFAAMEIEDPHLVMVDEENRSVTGVLGEIGLNHISNPITALLSVLGKAVNPGVAAAAAKAGLGVLSEMVDRSTSEQKDGGESDILSQPFNPNDLRNLIKDMGSSMVRAAADEAYKLAEYEDREMEILVRALVDLQLLVLKSKMQVLREL